MVSKKGNMQGARKLKGSDFVNAWEQKRGQKKKAHMEGVYLTNFVFCHVLFSFTAVSDK